ncbi:MAG: hypothetical protein HC819_14790 [Cyclobacteriaceae bacterium]|nr:hypothetical protein [Cyclobacteriaceae bacterium]
MEIIKFDINKVVAKDLTGEVIPVKVCETIGNVIYMRATTLDWDGIARKLYAGEVVDLTIDQLNVMEQVLLSPDTPIYLIVKRPLRDYIDSLKQAGLKEV